jgi:hypothetical protein
VRRQSARTGGAFGKEQIGQVTNGEAARNVDKKEKTKTGGSGA